MIPHLIMLTLKHWIWLVLTSTNNTYKSEAKTLMNSNENQAKMHENDYCLTTNTSAMIKQPQNTLHNSRNPLDQDEQQALVQVWEKIKEMWRKLKQ